jgi:hypothetical protein
MALWGVVAQNMLDNVPYALAALEHPMLKLFKISYLEAGILVANRHNLPNVTKSC